MVISLQEMLKADSYAMTENRLLWEIICDISLDMNFTKFRCKTTLSFNVALDVWALNNVSWVSPGENQCSSAMAQALSVGFPSINQVNYWIIVVASSSTCPMSRSAESSSSNNAANGFYKSIYFLKTILRYRWYAGWSFLFGFPSDHLF